ncbi:ATP-grasp domain-containing protein [Candidatus Gracilibacteria bacterium]|nr:ATP-grasp domain-containing protein [Candidatus Gracilibacteria bacterium]
MHIAILTGGISTEREIALRSGKNMNDWVQKAGHTSEVFDFPSEIHRFLQRHQASILARHFPTKQLKKYHETHEDFDLVIPMFHGIYGEDGQITAFLKTLGYRYAYSDLEVHNLCIDKYRTNLLLETIGILIPETLFLRKDADFSLENINFPAIVKPNHGGSSLSTRRVTEHDELALACADIIDDDILIQACIEGREFTVGVYLDMTGYHALPIIEIKTLDHAFFDYTEKYETDGSNEVFLEGEESLQEELTDKSIKIAAFLSCRGVVRIDYRYDGNAIYFLEVNTIPGFTAGSLIPKMWKKAGKTEKEFIGILYH